MTPAEPRLTAEDLRAWEGLRRSASLHARSRTHVGRVEAAKRRAHEALNQTQRPGIAASFGKDSMALAHLVAVELGAQVPVFCHRDDMDLPGATEHARTVAAAWSLDLTIITAPFSVRGWIEAGAPFEAYEDLHSRSSEMARGAFYDVVDAYNARFDLVLLGTRKHESRARMMDRVTHGPLWRRKPTATHPAGLWVAKPLCDWEGLDVYAYLQARGAFDMLPPWYRCISFMHERAPWRVREAWWLPESNTARHGGVAWLARYYPSLYADLVRWIPEARSMR